MPLNPYFNLYKQKNEQDLSHNLLEEVIQLAGIDVVYIKTESVNSPNFDVLLGENRFEELKDTYLIEMYPRNFEVPFMGGDLFSKMGITMNQSIVFEVAYRRFESVVGGRPREGDYIFVPALTEREGNDVFRIMYVDTDDEQYNPQGTILKYAIKCERATFAHQDLNTGIGELDYSVDRNFDSLVGDPNADNELIQELGDIFIDFNENHPFGKP